VTGTRDAVIIGGGPAGSAAAIALQGHGHHALVLEAERFPRHHVGESLVSLWPIFEHLGLAQAMAATFQHKRGSCRVWGRGRELQWTEFDSLAGGRNYSLQVERSAFDLLLLRRAAEMGADIREGHRVQGVIWEGDRAVGVRYCRPDGALAEAHAPWVIDASGRAGLIAKERGLRAVDPFYPDLSVYAYVKGARRFDGELAGNLLIEAVPWGWFWFIPLHTDEVSIGLVCDRTSRARVRARGVHGFFDDALASSRLVGPMAAAGQLSQEVRATASYGYASARYGGPGWLLAGDAGSFVDPMWATGVGNALTDGLLAAAVVEAVARGRIAESAAVANHDRQLTRRAEQTLALVRFVYWSNHLHADEPFWRARRQPAGSVSPARLLHRLSADPSVRYFRDAFRGMGHEPEALAPLDEALTRWDGRDATIGRLTQDLSAWTPRLREWVTLRPALGHQHYRLLPGLVIDHDGLEYFTTDPIMAAALEAIDGRTSANVIADAAAAAASPGEWVLARSRIIAGLIGAWQAGLIDAVPLRLQR
jgi:flavin-dependent dehydrogenase